MSKKKKKKKAPPAAPETAAPDPTEDPSKKSGNRWKIILAVSALVIGLSAAGLSTLPGYTDPSAELRICQQRQSRIATALLLYAKAHGGVLPPSLEALTAEGYLPQERSIFRCPRSRTPYIYVPDLERSMPPTTLVLTCPDQGVHRYDSGQASRGVWLYQNAVGADASMQPVSVREGKDPAASADAVRYKVKRLLDEQADVVALWRRAGRGDREGMTSLETRMNDTTRLMSTRSLAAWALGRSLGRDALPSLRIAFRRERKRNSPTALAVAAAMAKLGDREPVPFLIQACYEGGKYPQRRFAAQALAEGFGSEASPGLPVIRPYLPLSDRCRERAALEAWWEGLREK